jgi:circadian clock protein KaiC
MTPSETTDKQRVKTFISGLDEILEGGLVAQRAYLLRGGPGAGKTILGLHFLTAGIQSGETALYINMGETADQIRDNALGMSLDLSKVSFLDLSPTAQFFVEAQTYDVFSPAEVEREPTTNRITQEIQRLKPQRVFLDAITHFRYLSSDEFQFRRQMLSFLRFLVEEGATVLFTSEGSAADPDDDLQYMSDGIIHLKNDNGKRSISVTKLRGSNFIGGDHTLRLTDQGMQVFPRLIPDTVRRPFIKETISSGISELDELLHGGIERSTITIITGPTGVGKTTMGMQFMKEAAGRGERSVIYTFEEATGTLLERANGINIPVKAMIESGKLQVVPVEPLRFTPDEFARLVRDDVLENETRIVMIDSIAGYRLSVQGEDLTSHIHALGKYLQNIGVTLILINEIETIIGDFRATEVNISYLADNIIFLRYLELFGELRRAIGVLKKRLSNFEKTLREYEISRDGVKVGRPLTDLRGILTGAPVFDKTGTPPDVK